jgi:beta-lactamase regulating signal transducer with metallopeptidase domain
MVEPLAAYLVNAAWQTPVVALCALITAQFAGLSPRRRHWAWLAFLAAAVILPALSLADLLPAATPTVTRVAPGEVAASLGLARSPEPASAAPALALSPILAQVMAGVAAATAVAVFARLIVAACAARRLVKTARPAALPDQTRDAMAALAAAHGRRAPPVLLSRDIAGPAVVGVLHPVILAPEGLSLAGEDARAALLHETAHVLRFDYAANLACELITLPLAWHPALAGLKAGVRKSRELACDAIAAGAMGSKADYAKRLVSLARRLGERATTAPGGATHAALAVGLFGRSDLEDRLMHLMKPRETEAPLLVAARLSGLTAVGVGLLGSAALLHVTPVFAQAAAAPVPAPVAAAPLPALAAPPAPPPPPAPPQPPRPHHPGLMLSRHGVLITSGDRSHAHSWTAADGRTMTVYTDDVTEPTAEQERQWEDEAARAEAKAAEVEKRVNSPEFKARIAAAAARAADAEKLVNSPEFKARIAAAEARAADVRRRVDSPEFKARIAAAQARAAEAEAMVHSPEFRARIARAQQAAQAAADRLARQLDDFDRNDGHATP